MAIDPTSTKMAPSPADAAFAERRKRARARVYRRGGLLMIGFLAVVLVLSTVYVIANRHASNAEIGGLSFVIPKGASKNISVSTIDSAIDVPTNIVFKNGEPAVLSIRNDDDVANRAGPWVVDAGQTYTAKFDKPGTYEYLCSVDASESVTITVEGDEQ